MSKSIQSQKQASPVSWLALGLVLLGSLLVFLALSKNQSTEAEEKNTSAVYAQDFQATLLDGQTVQLSDYAGQIVMLNFWATWCPPCRAEMPTIQAAYQEHHNAGFTVLAINNYELPEQIEPFVNDLGLSFPILLDTNGRLAQLFQVDSFPTSLFLDPQGKIYASHTGMLSEAELTAYIKQGK